MSRIIYHCDHSMIIIRSVSREIIYRYVANEEVTLTRSILPLVPVFDNNCAVFLSFLQIKQQLLTKTVNQSNMSMHVSSYLVFRQTSKNICNTFFFLLL